MLYFVIYVILAIFPNGTTLIGEFIIPLIVIFLGLILVFLSYIIAKKVKITLTIEKT